MNFIKTLSAATLLVAAGSAFAQSGFQSAEFGRDGIARVVPSQRAESDAKHAQAFGRDVRPGARHRREGRAGKRAPTHAEARVRNSEAQWFEAGGAAAGEQYPGPPPRAPPSGLPPIRPRWGFFWLSSRSLMTGIRRRAPAGPRAGVWRGCCGRGRGTSPGSW